MSTKTRPYRISNRTSGAYIGTYAAADAASAVEAMYRDAGYLDGADAASSLGTTRERLYLDLCVEDA